MGHPPLHRRIILIDNHFQLRLAGAFILVQILLTGLFAFALYLFMDSELKAGLASAHAAYRSLDQMLLPLVAVLSGFSLLLSIVLVTAFVVILSHRIAGPLYRFRMILEGLAKRQVPPRSGIRPNDQLGEMANSMGQAMETLAADITALRATTTDLKNARRDQDGEALDRGIASLEANLARWTLPDPR